MVLLVVLVQHKFGKMGQIAELWLATGKVLPKCKLAILVCVQALASSFYKQGVSNFSMIIQGSRGTGKTRSIIMAVKEIFDQVYIETERESWRKYLLNLAPTSLVALDVGGVTIDSGVLNRRAVDSGPKCSALVKLVLVDEYSMVSLGWIAQISAARKKMCSIKESLLKEFQLCGFEMCTSCSQ